MLDVVRGDLYPAYLWHRQERRAQWQMPPGIRSGWVMSRDGLFVHVETGTFCSRSRAYTDPARWCSGEGVDSVRAGVHPVPLVVDVVLPVLMQRQALAVLFSLQVHQIQFFDVVGFQFLDMWVYIDKSFDVPVVQRQVPAAFSLSTRVLG